MNMNIKSGIIEKLAEYGLPTNDKAVNVFYKLALIKNDDLRAVIETERKEQD
jgi:hypothetical protein